MRITFLSPAAALVGLAVVLPVLSFALVESRARAARAVLRLPAPVSRGWPFLAAIVGLTLLLSLGAAQPVLERDRTQVVLSDAEAFFVFDTTRSMAAADSPGGRTRLDRAKALGRRLRSSLPELKVGLATLTDRVLPHLFPTVSSKAFAETLDESIGIERPASVRGGNRLGTSFDAIGSMARTAFFTPETERRALVVFTDAETRPFGSSELRRSFRRFPIATVLVRVGHDGERVFGRGGVADPAYRPVRGVPEAMATFAQATRGRAFEESEFPAAVESMRRMLGRAGPRAEAREIEPTPLAVWAFGAAFLPLAFVLWRRNLR